MGWGDCGTDRRGRPIGYLFEATCDHPGCDARIDRGLSYACGGMHGEDEIGCDRYFCSDHLTNTVRVDGHYRRVCDACAQQLLASGAWADHPEDGCIVMASEVEPCT